MPIYNPALAREVSLYSSNPYEYLYPGRKLISRDAVDLMKSLRAEGISVIVEPRVGPKLEYYFRKGISELLRDPIVLSIASIPFSIISGVVAAWITRRLEKGTLTLESAEKTLVIIEKDKSGRTIRYNEKGRKISDRRFERLMNSLDEDRRAYKDALETPRPFPELPAPIFLEHTSRIVGWARIERSDDGLVASPARITDDKTLERIQSGDLAGFSIAGIAEQTVCSICQRDYLDCNHIAGLEYDGVECENRVIKSKGCEVSVVREPINPSARRIDDGDEDE